MAEKSYHVSVNKTQDMRHGPFVIGGEYEISVVTPDNVHFWAKVKLQTPSLDINQAFEFFKHNKKEFYINV